MTKADGRAAQLERILDNIPEAVVVTDAEGGVAHLNQAAAAFLAGEGGASDGQSWPGSLAFYLRDGKTKCPRARLPLQRALRGETVQDEELFVRNGDRAQGGWVAMSARPLLNGNQEVSGAILVFRDVSYRKEVEMEMAELKNRLQANVERERLQVAQHLHDGPMQELYSIIYQIGGLRKQVEREHREALQNLAQDVQGVVQELRATAQELRPPTIANFGLEKAIRSHVADFRVKNPELRVRLSLAQDGQAMPEAVRLSLFRICQQSLANVARHAAASEVSIRFSFDAEEARLTITDNGQGFEVPRNWVGLARRGHFGLAGAAERAEALGGVFSVESEPGQGTTVSAVIPYREGAE